MRVNGAKAVVIGLGVSGMAATRFLLRKGASVTASDQSVECVSRPEVQALEAQGANLVVGMDANTLFRDADLVVISPGVPPMAELDALARSGIPVVSEVELASWYIKAPMVAVTGTNGKSTVTTLVGQMCASLGNRVFVGGNLGTPAIDVVDTEAAEADGLVVLELSSFQLERIQTFRPKVAALLNVSPDHLDRYSSYQAYRAAKARIFENQTSHDVAVVPAGDPECVSLASESRARLCTFGDPDGEVRIVSGMLHDDVSGLTVPLNEIGIKSANNMSNAACSCLISRHVGVSPDAIRQVLKEFRGLPHRMQFVSEIGRVQFYDDSKATNVGAAVAALDGMGPTHERVVIIVGGKDKGGSYDPLVQRIKQRCRAVVLMGETTPLLKAALAPTGVMLECVESMQEAVQKAYSLAHPGDAVLLAPACSSYDMFQSYVHRGQAFQAAVNALTQKEHSHKEAC